MSGVRVLWIDYTLWKSIVQTKSLDQFHQVVDTGTHHRVWSGHPEIIYACDVNNPTDFSDWTTEFSGTSTLVAREDIAIANIAGLGVPLVPRSTDGTPLVADRSLTLGNDSLKRTDDGTEPLNVNGLPAGASLIVWNGTGGSDTGGDWTRGGDGIESAAAAFSGTNGLDSEARGANDFSSFDNGSEIDVAGMYDSLQFQLQPKSFPGNGTLQIQWRKADTSVHGNTLLITDYTVNMDLDVWQQVSIPIADFGLTENVQELRIVYKTGNNQRHFFDDIELQAAGGGGPFTFQLLAPANECYHLSMFVLLISAPQAGWNPNTFANFAALANGVLVRARRISTGEVLWKFNSKDNNDLYGRYHPQDDVVFSDGTLLVGFMLKPGTVSVIVTDDIALEVLVRDDLSALVSGRAFAHYGIEVLS